MQAFVNSRDPHAGTDELSSPAGLADWMARHNMDPAKTPPDEATWHDALAVRDGLQAVLRAHNGVRLDGAVLERLNQALEGMTARARFESDTSLHLEAPAQGWPAALGRLLDAIVEAMASGQWERFKACRDESCQMAFFDASRNRMGKWCTVRRCGNRTSARTYRRRGPKWQRGARR
ncbi:MAG: CGNR zinc finger domain-containing protein [Acidobacteriota bacterium]